VSEQDATLVSHCGLQQPAEFVTHESGAGKKETFADTSSPGSAGDGRLPHLAACEIETGDHVKARQFHQQALDIRRRLLGPEHEEVAQAMNNLAKSHLDAEEYDDAERLFRASLEMITKLRGPQYVGTAAVSQNLAKCFYDKGDYSSALDAYERALAIRSARFPNGHPVVASTLVGMARSNLALGNLEKALDLATQATDMFARLKQEQLPEAGEAKGALGSVLLSLGKMEEARTALQNAKQVLAQVKPPPRLQSAVVALELAAFQTGQSVHQWDLPGCAPATCRCSEVRQSTRDLRSACERGTHARGCPGPPSSGGRSRLPWRCRGASERRRCCSRFQRSRRIQVGL
jgi:Flp pilus assembly protein TadD